MFASRLTHLRIKENITQEELANLLGLHHTTISLYERGLAEPRIKTLIKIADLFNVTVDYLIGRSDLERSDLYVNTK